MGCKRAYANDKLRMSILKTVLTGLFYQRFSYIARESSISTAQLLLTKIVLCDMYSNP